MLDRLVTASLEHRAVVLLLAALVIVWGVFSFQGLTIEAFPDPTDTQVQVITRNPGQPAEEMERQVSIPIERAVNGASGLARVRAINLFGLSFVTLTFRDGVDAKLARAQTLERLRVQAIDLGVQRRQHLARVATAAHQDDALDRVGVAAAADDALARGPALLHAGDLGQRDRRAGAGRHRDAAQVLGAGEQALAADHDLLRAALEHPAGGVV